MVSTGKTVSVARRHDRWGGFRALSATPLAPKRLPVGADSGASSALEPLERMQSGGPRLTRGFRYMLPPGHAAGSDK